MYRLVLLLILPCFYAYDIYQELERRSERPDVLQVRLKDGTKGIIDDDNSPLGKAGADDKPYSEWTSELLKYASDTSKKAFSVRDDVLDRFRSADESGLPDMKKWVEISLPSDVQEATEFIRALEAQENVDVIELEPEFPPEPPAFDRFRLLRSPDLFQSQGYLRPAPEGVDAKFAWSLGYTGSGITVIDIEYDWNRQHEDFTESIRSSSLIMEPGYTHEDPYEIHHGTAVVGVLAADSGNDIGVKGICYGSNIGMAPAYTSPPGGGPRYSVANAILLSLERATAGDVILIEQQINVCGKGEYGPSEWIQSVFDAVQTAVANGVTVVASAGNGGVNLDDESCYDRFNRNVRDSGAILVGAGAAGRRLEILSTGRSRLGFSSYGSRVDVQGWGNSVYTVSYGTAWRYLLAPNNVNRWYASVFSGTSSAASIVAGCVAIVQEMAKDLLGEPLAPMEVRELLRATGSAQRGDTSKHIGPLPDLKAIYENLASR